MHGFVALAITTRRRLRRHGHHGGGGRRHERSGSCGWRCTPRGSARQPVQVVPRREPSSVGTADPADPAMTSPIGTTSGLAVRQWADVLDLLRPAPRRAGRDDGRAADAVAVLRVRRRVAPTTSSAPGTHGPGPTTSRTIPACPGRASRSSARGTAAPTTSPAATSSGLLLPDTTAAQAPGRCTRPAGSSAEHGRWCTSTGTSTQSGLAPSRWRAGSPPAAPGPSTAPPEPPGRRPRAARAPGRQARAARVAGSAPDAEGPAAPWWCAAGPRGAVRFSRRGGRPSGAAGGRGRAGRAA